MLVEGGLPRTPIPRRRGGTHVDLVPPVALVQVVHDGAPVQLRQRGHVVHALLVRGLHSGHLLVGDCALLVREYLTGGGEEEIQLFSPQ